MSIGTLEWCRRTGGKLSFRDKLAQLGDAVVMQLELLPAQLRWRLGLPARVSPIDAAQMKAPDTAAARAAETHCREVSPPYLVNHCLRSYLWARLLSEHRRLAVDEELLYVACLLHDLGLTERYSTGRAGVHCFAIRGAEAASEVVRDTEWPAARAQAMAESITLHVNVRVGPEHGTEAALLNAATALDVTGLRFWELHPDTVRSVVTRVPRLQMKKEIWSVWKPEADAHPGCRAHFLDRYLQFGSRVRSAPFDE